jgi:hypothetical protein
MSETAAASAGPFPVPGLTPPTQRTGAKRRIGDVIVTLGFAEREKVEAVVSQGQRGVPLGQLLIDAGIVDSNQLAHALAERNGLDFVDLNVFEVDKGAANLIDAGKARRYRTMPIAFLGEGTLLVATADPANVLALDDITMATGYEVRRAVASPEDIDALISQISRLGDAVEEIDHDELDGTAEVIELRDQAEEAPVVKLVHSIIADAVQRGASDIHFEPRGGEMRVRFRLDGVVSDTTTVPRALTPGLVSRVKIMADLDIAEKRLPQDGRIGLTVDGHYVDLRVATLPVVRGESVVMRILDKQKALVDLDALGMAEGVRDSFREATTGTHGAILVTGPTGSGKTTTLYSGLMETNTPDKSIITIEDPVEYELEGVKQVQVRAAIDGPRRPGHHHGRRGARPRDGPARDRGCAHRAPRAHDASHEQRAAGGGAADRDGHRAIPRGRGRQVRGGPAAGATALRVPRAGGAQSGGANREPLRRRERYHGVRARRLRALRRHRLSRPDRDLRAHEGVRRRAAAGARQGVGRRAARLRAARGHADAPGGRVRKGEARRDLGGRGAARAGQRRALSAAAAPS